MAKLYASKGVAKRKADSARLVAARQAQIASRVLAQDNRCVGAHLHSGFASFPLLPVEIQEKIWEQAVLALPSNMTPAFQHDVVADKAYAKTRADPGLVLCMNPGKTLVRQLRGHHALLTTCYLSRKVMLSLKPKMIPLFITKPVGQGTSSAKLRIHECLLPGDIDTRKLTNWWYIRTTLEELADPNRANPLIPDGWAFPSLASRLHGIDQLWVLYDSSTHEEIRDWFRRMSRTYRFGLPGCRDFGPIARFLGWV